MGDGAVEFLVVDARLQGALAYAGPGPGTDKAGFGRWIFTCGGSLFCFLVLVVFVVLLFCFCFFVVFFFVVLVFLLFVFLMSLLFLMFLFSLSCSADLLLLSCLLFLSLFALFFLCLFFLCLFFLSFFCIYCNFCCGIFYLFGYSLKECEMTILGLRSSILHQTCSVSFFFLVSKSYINISAR